MYNFYKVLVVNNVFCKIALLLVLSWVIGVFLLSLKGLVHLFLVLAIILILISIIKKEM
ncbi:DUF5670 family protein [Arcicella rosea]|uniref:Lmo0937 family membrane protein n=1 Tax=Arcicella rosea TaxID=502909 RepID=A0A841EG74_9BACT|nr:hypothetical protein [Arcicella rosea]